MLCEDLAEVAYSFLKGVPQCEDTVKDIIDAGHGAALEAC